MSGETDDGVTLTLLFALDQVLRDHMRFWMRQLFWARAAYLLSEPSTYRVHYELADQLSGVQCLPPNFT